MPLSRLVPVALLALSTVPAVGHEFWIEPEAFQVAPGDRIVASTRTGQMFEGVSSPYIPQSIRIYDLALGSDRKPVEMRLGDRPSLDAAPLGEGLNVILHVTRDYRLAWDSFAKFEDFLRHKDAEWVLDAHRARGLGDDVIEGYSRYAKSLVAGGDGTGEDRAYGLLTEFVALENPYTDDLSDGFEVQVLYQNQPRPGAQVEVFARDAEGQVSDSFVRADDSGVAVIPVTPGVTYLLDAVVLREASEGLKQNVPDAMWESLWASLTFRAPG